MPLVLAIIAAAGTGALAFKSVTGDVERTAETTGSQLVTLGAAALGLYAAYNLLAKGKVF